VVTHIKKDWLVTGLAMPMRAQEIMTQLFR